MLILWFIIGSSSAFVLYKYTEHLSKTRWKILPRREIFGPVFYLILLFCVISGPIGYLWVMAWWAGSA